jgi:hypothetical protein
MRRRPAKAVVAARDDPWMPEHEYRAKNVAFLTAAPFAQALSCLRLDDTITE